jgi:hypothetical protein
MKFRDLEIGTTFDFVDDVHPSWNSFYPRCTKVSARGYTWLQRHPGETEPDRMMRSNVGTIDVDVYHVK